MKQRESFSSRLGFLLISAGCAIGLGNVWRFPYITGQYGGAAFVVVYLLFLVIMGLPVMVMEFSVGRGQHRFGLALPPQRALLCDLSAAHYHVHHLCHGLLEPLLCLTKRAGISRPFFCVKMLLR